ncbi:hypothetical protein QRO11_03620 [Paracidovorax citrulli]|uniref:hypothetical protein n=1 Tax=Paracidovorax citrulli TaxID=80869 RepID=UPI00087E95B0|nr:hypothetical protein [Paracidovorax citrulli]UMT89777.1 hypothetical protein FRC90_18025 [Paracidovorax citrulli]WIY35441.1 hypothetical protein QRO11_03620 [Paracidovorax citrulli]SDJ07443.1 hypothetical protein SAMN04489709_101160 [Paracidovorax citrulli]
MSHALALQLPAPEQAYQRPPLRWIIRRARRIQRAYGVTRRLAIFDARRDYCDFVGLSHKHLLQLVRGGTHV